MTRRRRDRPAPPPALAPVPLPSLGSANPFAYWPVLIFVVAIALRIAHVFQLRSSPLFDVLLGDAHGYDEWARRIAAGEWIGRDVFYQAPLYPYFLGVLYAIAGRDLLLVRIVQALIGASACTLVGMAAFRLFGKRAGLIAGLAMALYAPAIFFDALLQKTVLDVFFVSVMLWLVSRIITAPVGAGTWIALGAAVGALSLTRENALVFVVVLFVWSAFARPLASYGGTALGPFFGFALGLVLILGPVAIRNYAVGGGFYLTTSQFGTNFYIGNHRGADGTYVSLRPGRGAPEYERQDATELAEQATHRTLTPAEVSSFWTDRTLEYITAEPAAWLRLVARKAALLLNVSEMLDTESQESHAEMSWVLRALSPVGHFGVLIPLSIMGFVVTSRDWRRLWPLVAMLVAYSITVILLFVFARYRFPLVPFLVIFAAAGLASVREWSMTHSRTKLAVVVTLVAATALIVNRPMLSATRMRAITETNLGAGLHEAGRSDEALTHYRAAIAMQPDYLPAYNNLGVTLRSLGRVDEAIRAYEQGLSAGDSPELHFNLANALIATGRAADAERHLKQAVATSPPTAGTHNNLGKALAEQGRIDEAIAEFQAAIAADAKSATAHRNLGNLLATGGQSGEGLRHLSIAVELDPSDADAHYDLGSLLVEQQQFARGAEELRAALRLSPDRVEALNNLGIALASQGQIAEALTNFDRAVQLRPDFADAIKNRAKARRALGK